MSATTTAPANVVDYVRSLSAADKNAALVTLLTETMRAHRGAGLIPLQDTNGDSFGYFVPPMPTKEQVKAMVERLTPEERQRGNEALKDLSRTFDMKEFMDELDREDPD
jgi:hypothetical protein